VPSTVLLAVRQLHQMSLTPIVAAPAGSPQRLSLLKAWTTKHAGTKSLKKEPQFWNIFFFRYLHAYLYNTCYNKKYISIFGSCVHAFRLILWTFLKELRYSLPL